MDSSILLNRIDFCGIIVAERCNPNGDPLNSNAPRQDFSGYGIISDVCLKRKIRDRLFDSGYDVFVVRQENLQNNQTSLLQRTKEEPALREALKTKDNALYRKIACEKWIDVRAFGQVFAFKTKGDAAGLSVSVRGPVSVGVARTLDAIVVSSFGITKAVNSNAPESTTGYSRDIMGSRLLIDRGAYVFKGSMYPQLAKVTGFTYADALAVKKAMLHIFLNDSSAARPSGSISLDRLYWWEHNCPNGQYSPARVFKSLKLEPAEEEPYYTATLVELPGLKVEVLEGW